MGDLGSRRPGEIGFAARARLASGRSTPARGAGARREGFSLLEVLLVASIALVAVLGMSRSLGDSIQLTGTNRDTALATDAAREVIEGLSGHQDFGALLGLHADTGFDVRGLEPVPGDPDGRVGEIVFPTVDVGGLLELREDGSAPDFPVPRDLNGDGSIDSADHSTDYVLLPVLVRLRWSGSNGERALEFRTLLADL